MKFFKILDELKEEYKNNFKIRDNGTLLLAPGSVPRACHMLFKPLNNELIEEFLISQCVHRFPEQYIEFLKYSNGANLCNVKVWHTIKKKKIAAAGGLFVIYGLPRTQPYGRPQDMEEPYDVRIEDLARHDEISKMWLKCGNYIHNYDFHKRIDIFIDTETEKVFGCVKNQKCIVDSWNTLDECFCSIYNSLRNRKEEYEF